jgi:hypothetical protein
MTAEQKALKATAALLDRRFKREQELRPLADKFWAAREAGLDINESDKTRLLALLLDDKLDGLGNYTSTFGEKRK